MSHFPRRESGYHHRRGRCDSMDSDESTGSSSPASLSAECGEFVPGGGHLASGSSASCCVEVVPTERSAADRYQYDRNPTGILISTAGGQTAEVWSGVVIPKSWSLHAAQGSQQSSEDDETQGYASHEHSQPRSHHHHDPHHHRRRHSHHHQQQ